MTSTPEFWFVRVHLRGEARGPLRGLCLFRSDPAFPFQCFSGKAGAGAKRHKIRDSGQQICSPHSPAGHKAEINVAGPKPGRQKGCAPYRARPCLSLPLWPPPSSSSCVRPPPAPPREDPCAYI